MIANSLVGVANGVKRARASRATRKAGVFPPLAAQLLTVGEETGRLDQMFARMAEITKRDTGGHPPLHQHFRAVVILVMGIVVGGLV